ncbi:crotonase/enoyl-CoA hydratase family protein [Orrella daihaiensis]|uniref:Crotonase/enoyl-CoA hydratase family protein n=1 Tax=Orrella daihaiensis TaxID=2782176 RepID=A0ABY4AI29_9BURK|nr:crotonase/enoyl-CoA hydratase family protein [Orrella daihaiensis]UOD49951.1 crotonase/enoyl-CoA hydratase family protein [Orrella daihaiensis]
MSAQELVLTEVVNGVLVITVNRPDARNAVNYETAEQLAHAFERLDADSNLRLGILTGAGKGFSAGMDLKDFAKSRIRPRIGNRGFAGLTEGPPAKPLIAAVEGFALAGGFEMVLACDMVVAAKDAKFGLPEVKRGLVPGSGGMLRLPRRLPYPVAMEMVLTGDMFSAERAHQYGLVNVLTEPGQALVGALTLADRISENGPLAIQTAKAVINQSLDWAQDEMFAKQAPLIKHIFESEDAREGSLAFAEKRKPVWQGR